MGSHTVLSCLQKKKEEKKKIKSQHFSWCDACLNQASECKTWRWQQETDSWIEMQLTLVNWFTNIHSSNCRYKCAGSYWHPLSPLDFDICDSSKTNKEKRWFKLNSVFPEKHVEEELLNQRNQEYHAYSCICLGWIYDIQNNLYKIITIREYNYS